jgi:hypothetical protein
VITELLAVRVVEVLHVEMIEAKYLCSGTRVKLLFKVIYATHKVLTNVQIA